jgi:hypothetical protein
VAKGLKRRDLGWMTIDDHWVSLTDKRTWMRTGGTAKGGREAKENWVFSDGDSNFDSLMANAAKGG